MNREPEELGALIPDGTAYLLRFERRYNKPIERVWAALTVPERIADWLAVADVDLRISGAIGLRFGDHAPEPEGRIVELVPPRLIAWTWPHASHPDSVVRFELFPSEEGCRLVLTQSGLEGPHHSDVVAGWHTHLEGLPDAAEGMRVPWRAEREREIAKLYAGLSRG